MPVNCGNAGGAGGARTTRPKDDESVPLRPDSSGLVATSPGLSGDQARHPALVVARPCALRSNRVVPASVSAADRPSELRLRRRTDRLLQRPFKRPFRRPKKPTGRLPPDAPFRAELGSNCEAGVDNLIVTLAAVSAYVVVRQRQAHQLGWRPHTLQHRFADVDGLRAADLRRTTRGTPDLLFLG